MVEVLIAQRSNPTIHCLAFASTSQDEEPIQNYLVRLRAAAVDCNFTCPSCEYDLSDIYIKDQIIWGIVNDTLQADLLAKAGMLKSLEQNVCDVEAFESALRDQNSIAGTSDAASAQLSAYRRQKNMPQANKGKVCANTYLNHNNSDAKPSHQACVGCGSHQHGVSGTGSRQLKCLAWGQKCSNCGKPNHLPRVCWARKTPQVVRKSPGANETAMDTLIAHITFNQTTGTYTFKDTGQIRGIDTYIVPFLPKLDPR